MPPREPIAVGTSLVYCTDSRGKRYRVVFHSGEPYSVFSLFRRFTTLRPTGLDVERCIWHRHDKHISLAAICAINAAKATRALAAKATAAPPDRSAPTQAQEAR